MPPLPHGGWIMVALLSSYLVPVREGAVYKSIYIYLCTCIKFEKANFFLQEFKPPKTFSLALVM